MSRVVVDSNVIFARFSARDEYHDRATAIFDAVDRTDLPQGVIVSLLLPEVLNPIQKLAGHDAATKFYRRLRESAGFRVEWLSREIHGKALADWQDHPGAEFTDAAVARFMRAADIEYIYSFDDDFDSFDGITRLNAPIDPFEP
jgi:predicted nucleic acid-binding protein